MVLLNTIISNFCFKGSFLKKLFYNKILLVILFVFGFLIFFGVSQGLSGESSSNKSICDQKEISTNSQLRRCFTEKKEIYDRTRDLIAFQDTLAKVNISKFEQIIVPESKVSMNLLQRELDKLSLFLEVNEWLTSIDKKLHEETWVPGIVGEIKAVKSERDKWFKILKEESKKLSNIQSQIMEVPSSENISLVYAIINYSESLLRIQGLFQSLQLNDNIAKAISDDTIKGLLEKAVQASTESQDSRAKAYALTYMGNRLKSHYFKQKSKPTDLLLRAQNLTESALKIIYSEMPIQSSHAKWNWQNIAYRAERQLGEMYSTQEEKIAAYSDAVDTLESMRQSILSADIDDQFRFRDEVQPVYREYVSLLLRKGNDSSGNLKKARDLIESLQLAELENFLGCNLPERKVADELANNDESAVIVYPIILPDRLEVIFSFPPKSGEKERKLKHYSKEISKEKLEIKLRELRYRLEQPYITKKAQQISKEIYSWLIEGAQGDSDKLLKPSEKGKPANQTLLFVADGALRNIPMAALEDSKGHYLIEKYAVAIAPRLQLLVDDRQRPKDPRIILAGLTYKPKDTNFGTLKYVKDEIDAIEGIFKKDFKRLIGKDFTRETLRDNLAKGADIVHLATHGEFNYSKKNTFILTEEGKVDLEELENLFQNNRHPIDLLVLSACETATGDDRDTLGIAGMTVRSGARSSIASLWSIDDPATVLVMKEFYSQLQNGVSKAQALRKSIILMLDKSNYRSSQWAPYVLVGDWQ